MKKGLTELIFILDRSGSMDNLTDDTIGGFNSMIESQKKEDGEAYVTTVLFDTKYEILHNYVHIQEIKPMTYNDYYARGCTALLDAVGTTINTVGERLAATSEEERPEKVIFVIITDGYENASREFSRAKVKEMIEHQQDKYSWVFMFLGANMDAVSEAGTIGISKHFAATYTPSDIGTASVYTCTSNALSAVRGIDTMESAVCYMDAIADCVSTSLESIR